MFSRPNDQLQRLLEKIDSAYEELNIDPRPYFDPDLVRHVAVILGSSRSGSSFLFHALNKTGAFWAPQGEETPFHRLCGIGWIKSFEESDAAVFREEQISRLRDLLMNDVGRESPSLEANRRYLAQSAARLIWQWPERRMEDIVVGLREALDGAHYSWLKALERLGVAPSIYDLPGVARANGLAPSLPARLFEEPPFVAQTPRPSPLDEGEDMGSRPLLLKTSTHAYRLPLLRQLFPRATFSYILLARNPAASVNGLIDGWLSNAFHSHRLGEIVELRIEGYSERMPDGDRWWKFDVPPGWGEYTHRPLAEVCAFQWREAYRHILRGTEGENVLQVRLEDLVDPARARNALSSILDFLGARPEYAVNPTSLPPVMASARPSPARWRAREDEILPLLKDSSTQEVAERLGYDLSSLAELL